MLIVKNVWFIIPFFLSVFVAGCSETRDAFYVNFDAAKKAGAFERGWIPDIIPESSKEIHERHNLDTNKVWVRFEFERTDIKKLLEQIEEVPPAETENIEFRSPGRVNWWPQKIDRDYFRVKNSHPSLKIYKYNRVLKYSDNRQKKIASFFMIDWDSNTAYYWQNSS